MFRGAQVILLLILKKNTTKCIQLFKWWEPKISINNHLYVLFDFSCFHFYSDDRTVHLKK